MTKTYIKVMCKGNAHLTSLEFKLRWYVVMCSSYFQLMWQFKLLESNRAESMKFNCVEFLFCKNSPDVWLETGCRFTVFCLMKICRMVGSGRWTWAQRPSKQADCKNQERKSLVSLTHLVFNISSQLRIAGLAITSDR